MLSGLGSREPRTEPPRRRGEPCQSLLTLKVTFLTVPPTMSAGFSRTVLGTTVLAAIVSVWPALPGFAEPSQGGAATGESILLLRNGNLLRGQITQEGDHYDVVIEGGQIQVKRGEVELFCRTLEEGYGRKRVLVRPGDVRAHLELAQWCQRYGLFGPAGDELAQAKALDPRHPLIPLLERRIRMSRWQPKPVEPRGEPAQAYPSPNELALLVRGMPPGSVETFTRTIQPLLVNNCSTAGCHGPQTESEFQLLRIAPGRPPSRGLTQRNLHSTLQWIDRQTPAESPILTAPIRPHGSAKAAVFTDRQFGQYRQLVDWVHDLADRPTPRAAPETEPERLSAVGKPPWLAMQALYAAPPGSDEKRSAEADLHAFSPDGIGLPIPPDVEALPPGSAELAAPETDPQAAFLRSTIKRGATLPRFVPIDPFDPEIFNRRFFPDRYPGPSSAPHTSRSTSPESRASRK